MPQCLGKYVNVSYFFFGWFPEFYTPTFRDTLYEDGTECSEMSGHKIQNIYTCQDSWYSGQNLNQDFPEYKPGTLQTAPFCWSHVQAITQATKYSGFRNETIKEFLRTVSALLLYRKLSESGRDSCTIVLNQLHIQFSCCRRVFK
jgi:hypothetical protein